MKDHKEISSINIINDRNHFILKFKLNCLLQALEAMAGKPKVKMELKITEETTILLFEVIYFYLFTFFLFDLTKVLYIDYIKIILDDL